MPPIIIAAIAVYAGAITLASFVLITASYALSQYQASRARRKARDAYNASLRDRLVTTATVDGFRSRCYGRVRNVDGVLFKATRGDKSEFYTLVIGIAGHECDAIEQVYFNDAPVTLDAQGYVTDAPYNRSSVSSWTRTLTLDGSGNGSFTPDASFWRAGMLLVPGSVYVYAADADGRYSVVVPHSIVDGGVINVAGGAGLAGRTVELVFQGSASTSKARVRKFLGAPGQDLSTILAPLFPGLIAAGVHRFEGMCCLIVDLEYDQDAFPTGVPNISAVVRGAKVLDPRTGVTAWTQNPALIARDWALYAQGGGAVADDLVLPSFVTAANACDVSHTFRSTNAAGVVVDTVRPLYACNMVCRTDASPDDTLSAIVEAMAGKWAWTGGQLRIKAGAYTAPVATLTESWCSGAGDIELVAGNARTELVNVYTPTIADASQHYLAVPVPRLAAAAYIAADGGELPQDITLEGVTNADHAQHVCGVLLRDQRQGLAGTIPCNLSAYPVEVFDTIALQLPRFGFAGKEVEVLGWQFSQSGGVVLQFKETGASIFDPDAGFTRSDPEPNTALADPFTVAPVDITTLASGSAHLLRQDDGTIVSRVLVAWAPLQDAGVENGGAVEVRYGPVGTPVDRWQTVNVPGAETSVYLTGLQDGAALAISARARNKLVAGDWCLLRTHIVQGKLAAPAAVVGLTAAVVPGALKISRTPSTEADYARTLYRYGPTWATATAVPGPGDASGCLWPWPAPGSYTLWAADVDTSGIVGVPVSVGPVVVRAAQLGVSSGNLIPNSDQQHALTWGNNQQTVGVTMESPVLRWSSEVSAAAYILQSATTRNLVAHQTNIVSGGNGVAAWDFYPMGGWGAAFSVPLEGDGLVCFAYYAQAHRCDVGGGLSWFGADGAFIGTSEMPRVPGPYAEASSLSLYARPFVIARPPAGAVRVCPYMRKYNTWEGTTGESYIWLAAPLLCPVPDGAETPPSYVPGAVAALGQLDPTLRADLAAAAADAADAITSAAGAQATADGKVSTYIQPSPPAAEAVGDLWMDSDDGNKLYRWSGASWVQVRDTGIAQALADAGNAQATADGKIVSFYQPSPPTAEAVGDLWTDTDDGNKLYRWSGSSWVSVRDAGIAQALSDAAAAQATADNKIELFYQPTAPGGQDGDLWFDTDDGNRQYVKVAGVWTLAADTRIGQALSDAAEAQATADGKVTTFFAASAPTAEAVGDLWFNTTDNRVKRWNGSSWATQSVIGAGDVGTSELANAAATEVTVVALPAFSYSNIA